MNKIEINKIYQEDCIETMKRMADNFVDMTLTSPPYDNLRDYKGYTFDFESIAKELFRITKNGGVVVWVVGDMVVDKSETGTAFKQALFFKEVGFLLHDTMIYKKRGSPFPESNRYWQQFEYMFIFSKGSPKTTNLLKIKTQYAPEQIGKPRSSTTRNKDGSMEAMKYEGNKEFVTKGNVWEYAVGFMKSSKDKYSFEHPATYPEDLASDHIKSWSNEGDLIYDPMIGSGTTGKMAVMLKRNYIGSEVSKEYAKLAEDRIKSISNPLF